MILSDSFRIQLFLGVGSNFTSHFTNSWEHGNYNDVNFAGWTICYHE